MLTYIVRRLFLMIPTMLGITLIVVGIMLWAPGEPGMEQQQGPSATAGGEARVKRSKGLNDAKREMGFFDEKGEKYFFPVAWWNWLTKKFLRLDFGESFRYYRPVGDLLAERIPVTVLLNVIALVLIWVISIPIGIYSATHRGTTGDAVTSSGLFMLYSMPSWWVATMLVLLFSSATVWNIFEVDGLHAVGAERFTLIEWLLDLGKRLVLPITCMVYGGFAATSRYMRSGMLEVVRQDFIRTARAKGLSERRVIHVHALRNALIPIITLLAGFLPAMIGGSIIVELIFSIRGMGLLGYEAILNRDYMVVMANTVFAAFLTLVGILVSDLAYVIVDPRISLD